MRYVEFMKKVVPMHDDLWDFFYEALPGYEENGRRRILLGCWGAFQDPDVCNFAYKDMEEWGRAMFVTPGVVVDGKLVTNSLVDINLGIRILLGSSYYDDWEDQEMFVTRDPLGNPVDRRHPWNQHTNPQPQKRDFSDKYSWVMSPRWFDGTDHLALDTGGGPIARLWSTALSGLVDTDNIKATGHSVEIHLPKTALKGEVTLEWKIPEYSNTLERNRARTYFQAYAAAAALHFAEKSLEEIRAGHTKTWQEFTVPDEAIGCGFTEAVRGVLSHHMVIKGGKIANYHPYPPTPWNANPTDSFGTPGPYEDAVMNTPIFEENSIDDFKGIDIMRAVRSFDPCLPCGVHMYLGRRQGAAQGALADRLPDDRGLTGERVVDEARTERSEWNPSTSGRPATASRSSSTVSEPHSIDRPGNRSRTWSALVTELYGGGLARILELIAESEDRHRSGRIAAAPRRGRPGGIAAGPARPAPPRPRGPGAGAVDSVRPYLGSHGGDVEVLAIDADEGVVTVRMLGSCDGCASSSVTLELAVQTGHRGSGTRDHPDRGRGGRDRPRGGSLRTRTGRTAGPIPVTLGRKPEPPASDDGADLRTAGARPRSGRPARDRRAPSSSSAGSGRSSTPTVSRVSRVRQRPGRRRRSTARCCAAAACARAYDLPRAGRSLDGNRPTSTRCPLLEEGGEVRIAVAAAR